MSALFSNLLRARSFPSSTRTSPPIGERKDVQESRSSNSKRYGYVKSKDRTHSTRQDIVKGSKITKQAHIPSSAKAKKADKRNWNFFDLLKFSGRLQTHENEDSLEGETLVDEEPPIKCELADKDEVTMAVEETLHEPLDNGNGSCLPFEDRAFQPDDERIQDWSEDEVWVFNRLVMRGQEPILPYELASEFPSWPDALFSDEQDKVVINNISRSTINLASAFNRFLYEGISVRCRLQGTTNVEPPIERALKGLHRFFMQDGHLRLKGSPPLICIAAAAANEDVAHVVERCIQKMYTAGRQWRHWLMEENTTTDASQETQPFAARLPTIYGYVVKFSVLAIMTWDSSLGDEEGIAKPVRTLGTYDWKIEGQDVWHALAVGIVECKARGYLMELDREGLLGEDRVASDPDL